MKTDILVIGAGVAGLQAIATCNRLGAKVTGFDVRESTKEQVESVGGKFLELDLDYGDSDKQGYAKEQSSEKQKGKMNFYQALFKIQIALLLQPQFQVKKHH